MKIISLDPGVTTGVAIKLGEEYITMVSTKDHELYDILNNPMWDAIVYEDFMAVTISGYGLYTVRLIGAIKALAYINHNKLYRHVPQNRTSMQAKAKTFLTQRNLPHVIHEIEALAHLLFFEKFNV